VSAEDYNSTQIAAGKLTPHHITALVRHWQTMHVPLDVDGAAGPATIASIEAALRPAASAHWLSDATAMPIHQSWFGGPLAAGKPLAIVAHYTATDPGTGVNMATRRQRQFGADPDDRAASWHVTIETDGSVIQMIPLDHVAWHAGSDTAKPIPGVGWANSNTVGIELVGYGKSFPEAQVTAACRVWREIVQMYGIPRAHAMVTHQSIDPTRREDPGPVWLAQHATRVLNAAYA
jgi:N-acetylmuramoyl-L-alanine amidase